MGNNRSEKQEKFRQDGQAAEGEQAEEQLERLEPGEAAQVETQGAVLDADGQPDPGQMKIDLHCHSEASLDCSTPLALFPARCQAPRAGAGDHRSQPDLGCSKTSRTGRGTGGRKRSTINRHCRHGFDPLKRWRLKPDARLRIADSIDIVETFNARVSRPRWNRAGVAWAQDHGAWMSAGSDAHTLADIGCAWVETAYRPIHAPQDLLQALEGGTPTGE
jgi:hypothetical protein